MQGVKVLSYSASFEELSWSNFGGTWWFQWLKPEQLICIWLSWQGGGSRETAGVVFVKKEQEQPQCWTEQSPAGSKTNPQLPKADTVSNAGGTSLITRLLQS